ncbi:MAG: dihydroorotase [Planctomycetota bacterium]
MKRLLKNARVVDPAGGLDEQLDVLVEDARIARLEKKLSIADAEVVDLAGKVVCPGFIDMHVHLREPGQEWKETVGTGTRAAARGGFTGVACMPNTEPVNDSRSVTEFILRQARIHGVVPVYPIGCVTKEQAGKQLAEMHDMLGAGAVAFSDDGKPVYSSLMMRKALEYSKIFGVPVIDHCEDTVLVDGGVMNEGEISTRLGLRGWPAVAEDVMVQRDLLLAEYTGGHVHIAHLSTGRSAEFVREAKRRGVRATCEVTPHHLVLTDHAVGVYDTNAKMNPPLRTERDCETLIEALVDGTVDAIATDHAPHHSDEKCVEFALAPMGIVGLETAVSICLDKLVHSGRMELPRLVELFTSGPAEIIGLAAHGKGRLAVDGPADITVLDLDAAVTIDPAEFESKSSNTPFGSWELRGGPFMTIVAGELVHDGR